MKVKRLGLALAAVLGVTTLFTGCGGSTQIDFYAGDKLDSNGNMIFNEELFYLNENKGPAADPFVLDDTARSGYYYISSTQGDLMLYRSKDMMTMEPVGPALDIEKGTVIANATGTRGSKWAPEFIYDEDDGCYYVFFSAKPVDGANGTFTAGKGVIEGTGYNMPYLGRSDKPEGPYTILDFTNPEEVGAYTHSLNDKGNVKLNLFDFSEGIWGVDDDGQFVEPTETNYADLWRPSYPQAYAKYAYLDPASFASAGMSIGKTEAQTNGGYSNGIDLHPFVDPETGDKYLYLTMNSNDNFIVGLKMKKDPVTGKSSWLNPDWKSFTPITRTNYWTIEDWRNDRTVNDEDQPCYDIDTNINEGTTVIYHRGVYYLTFSAGRYEDSTYQVCQAVADSPLGPYRKLREYENGILLSGDLQGSQEMSGTGHHAILTIGKQMFIYYHSHNDYEIMGTERHGNIDELKWVTITDYRGDPLDVLVANGPTATLQPRIEAYAKYRNLAEDAVITLTDKSALEEGSKLKYAYDGLLSTYKYGDYDFYETYMQETRIVKTATFVVDLEKPSSVRAVMVYNSKNEWEIFLKISRMEFITKSGKKYYLKNVPFPKLYYTMLDITGEVDYVRPGAAAFAEFYELKDIQTVRITIEVPKDQEVVGISEIRVLGR